MKGAKASAREGPNCKVRGGTMDLIGIICESQMKTNPLLVTLVKTSPFATSYDETSPFVKNPFQDPGFWDQRCLQ